MSFTPYKLNYYQITGLLVVVLFVAVFFWKADERGGTPCVRAEAVYMDSSLSVEERVADLMRRMTNREKIGQMAVVEKNSIKNVTDIRKYNLGTLISGFGAKPEPNTAQNWQDMVDGFNQQARQTCLQIPLLYGIDAIHGFTNVPEATIFPHAIGLAATRNPGLVREIAAATAREIAAAGIYWNFAPNLDVPADYRWGRVYETFGSDPALVSELGQAYLEGLQSTQPPVLGTLKHYLGNGAMEWDTSVNKNYRIDQGNARMDTETLREVHLRPFEAGIESGAKIVMVGLNSVNGVKMAGNHRLITDVLKTELEFEGAVVSDWYAVYELHRSKFIATYTAVNAGVDMVMLPFDYKTFIADMERAIKTGKISQARLDDAVNRILTVKFQLGLFDKPTDTKSDLSVIGSTLHRQLARQAVRESQVLLKNENNAVPIVATDGKILVAGSGADNLGRQSGGWTVEWQGIDGNWISGTTILQAIRNAASADIQIEYNQLAEFEAAENLAKVGIAVVSEKPYAEGQGDHPNPALDPEDLAVIERLRAISEKLIVIIISGRPIQVHEFLDDADAVIASWLPGSEGEGVSDVLFGSYEFTGHLPVEWSY